MDLFLAMLVDNNCEILENRLMVLYVDSIAFDLFVSFLLDPKWLLQIDIHEFWVFDFGRTCFCFSIGLQSVSIIR
jgi:hypothetical protein